MRGKTAKWKMINDKQWTQAACSPLLSERSGEACIIVWYHLRLLRNGASAQYFLVYEWNASVGGDNIGVVLWKLDF